MEREGKAEDWCFVCKDGGDLLLCDNRNCSKVYHLECVGYDRETTSQIEDDWTCECHSCSSCKGASEVHCFCCPTSFCKNCIKSVKFVHLRANKGLCTDCWTLVRLAEQLSVSEYKSVDFEDRDTHECLFKEYWEIVKKEEGLRRGDLVAVEEPYSSKGRRHMRGTTPTRVVKTLQDRDTKSNTFKLITSWGSKPLIEFLTSIGVDITTQLSQCDVSSIILKYVQERDLIHPIKKKKIICDRNLHLIFKKNTIPLNQIDALLGPHFSHGNDTQRTNNEKKRCLESDPQNGDAKHQKALSCSQEKSPNDKAYFASIVAHNMKLVYLRKSLVEDLLEQPESFEDKVVGSFVKVMETESREIRSKGKISQQLLQVTAVKKMSSTDGSSIGLNVWTLPDIQISMLSDSDITEEDCQDLREKMAKGLFQRPTVEEIEKKAQILHQDIRKDWMKRELVKLQNLIDRANEKGRRSELYQLIDQRQTLKKEAEQQQQLLLLKQLPIVIVDTAEAEADDSSLKFNPPSL
ncbi:zinc finger CCCH domain-containing protein 44-like isoform X1 [Cucurbita moschata]|uniref:Zinc finger CCCH domain-containing protein 44-like isoform X1 n=1 Tax=Cucurbita moschata TaxID=3662 RepID=A0A6J1EEH9_CUCMO|nr:zinc finger CCCH domain-containing protein 44-like isoform X1 [Cucurbita moschata]